MASQTSLGAKIVPSRAKLCNCQRSAAMAEPPGRSIHSFWHINARWHINVAQFLCSTHVSIYTCKETWPNSILRWKCTFLLLLLYILARSEYVPCLKTHSLSCFSKQLSSTKWLVVDMPYFYFHPMGTVVLPASPTHVRKPGKFRKCGFGSPQRGLPTRDLGPAPHLVTCDMFWHVLTDNEVWSGAKVCLSSKVLPVLTRSRFWRASIRASLSKNIRNLNVLDMGCCWGCCNLWVLILIQYIIFSLDSEPRFPKTLFR